MVLMSIGVMPDGRSYRCDYGWFSWRPLADYIRDVAPEFYSKHSDWQSGFGEGLTVDESGELAKILTEEIDSGRTAAYEVLYNSEIWFNDRRVDEYPFQTGRVIEFRDFLQVCDGWYLPRWGC